jgi:hypothetical protein
MLSVYALYNRDRQLNHHSLSAIDIFKDRCSIVLRMLSIQVTCTHPSCLQTYRHIQVSESTIMEAQNQICDIVVKIPAQLAQPIVLVHHSTIPRTSPKLFPSSSVHFLADGQ